MLNYQRVHPHMRFFKCSEEVKNCSVLVPEVLVWWPPGDFWFGSLVAFKVDQIMENFMSDMVERKMIKATNKILQSLAGQTTSHVGRLVVLAASRCAQGWNFTGAGCTKPPITWYWLLLKFGVFRPNPVAPSQTWRRLFLVSPLLVSPRLGWRGEARSGAKKGWLGTFKKWVNLWIRWRNPSKRKMDENGRWNKLLHSWNLVAKTLKKPWKKISGDMDCLDGLHRRRWAIDNRGPHDDTWGLQVFCSLIRVFSSLLPHEYTYIIDV